MFRRIFAFQLWLILGFFVTAPVMAAPLTEASGEVILTVKAGDGTSTPMDIAGLQAMGETSFSTSTIWTEGVHTYSGLSLKALVDALGITGGTLRMYAANDYNIDVPVSDAVEGGPILAYLQDGKAMSLRDKGPVWLIYPFDDNVDYQAEAIYSRSIWQLVKIEVLP